MGQILGPPGMATSLVTAKLRRPYKARFRSGSEPCYQPHGLIVNLWSVVR